MIFGIDLGHKCYPDTGAVGVVTEESIIDSVGSLVINKLRNLGHTVIELRPTSCTNVSNSLLQRYNKSDVNNCDICVSIHANCGGGHGTEIFTYGAKDVAGAKNILENICSLGFTNRGIKDGSSLAMVRRPQATSMLIEICFCDSQSDIEIYKNNVENLANAIVGGLTGQAMQSTKYKIGWNEDNCGWFYSQDGNNFYSNCWKQIKGSDGLDYYYKFNSDGYMCSQRWILENNKWYYVDSGGGMIQARLPEIARWQWIDGKCYCFGTDGVLYQDCVTYDGYTVDENGAWIESIPKK